MPVNAPRVLIACIGNIFLGDDGFGVEVARRLRNRHLPPNYVVKDFGIRGLDFMYALLEDWDIVVVADAVSRDGEPGTLYVIEPDLSDVKDTSAAVVDAHAMDPTTVLRTAVAMGARLDRVRVVGCEPAPYSEEQTGLSPVVTAAADQAARMIESVVHDMSGANASPTGRSHK